MGSLSSSKLFCFALAVLALVLIEDSLAGFASGKCHDCKPDESQCPTKECNTQNFQPNFGTEFTCRTIYKGDKKDKECENDILVMEKVLDGLDKCQEFDNYEDYLKKRAGIEFDLDPVPVTRDDYIAQSLNALRSSPRYLGNDTKVTVCSCDKDSCNDDDYDKKNLGQGNNGNNGNSGRGSGSVNVSSVSALVIVFILASAALVPGFLRSQ